MSRRLLAALLLAVGAGGVALPAAAAQDQPGHPGETDTPTGSTAIEDVTLRWGLNDESSNRAFAPDTYNFFSAGRIPDPGRGGTTIDRADWSSRDGAVQVEKWDGTAWRRATWAGLRTTSAGEPLGSPTAGTFSNHTVTVSGGDGVVDPVEGTATIAWEGEVTVLYYSGMSFFHLADPVLEVADGVGVLTAEVSGYASSQADPDVWEPVAPERVTVADLPDVEVDALTDGSLDTGVSWRPAYLGVRVSGVPQQRDGEHAGSFPQSFVDVMDRLGTAAFWFSSGGSTDAFKVAAPLTLSTGEDDVVGPTPTAAPTGPGTTATPAPPTVVPPPATVTATVTAAAAPTSAPAPAPSAPAPPVGEPSATSIAPVTTVTTQTRLLAAPATATPRDRPDPLWWVGGSLLLLSVAVLLVPVKKRNTP